MPACIAPSRTPGSGGRSGIGTASGETGNAISGGAGEAAGGGGGAGVGGWRGGGGGAQGAAGREWGRVQLRPAACRPGYISGPSPQPSRPQARGPRPLESTSGGYR